MGEPEAGSEFAIGAAAAGEARCPGFGVTVYHPQGIGRVWTECKIIPFLSPIQYSFQFHRGPKAKERSGQQRVNIPFRTPGILCYWGGASGMSGEAENFPERAVWRMPWVGRPPGPNGAVTLR